MGGLFVATFLTLLSLPALYALWFRSRMKTEMPVETRVGDQAEEEPQPLPLAAE